MKANKDKSSDSDDSTADIEDCVVATTISLGHFGDARPT